MTRLEKAERIAREDRELVRDQLASIAERLRQIYPNMNFKDVNSYLHQMLDVSV